MSVVRRQVLRQTVVAVLMDKKTVFEKGRTHGLSLFVEKIASCVVSPLGSTSIELAITPFIIPEHRRPPLLSSVPLRSPTRLAPPCCLAFCHFPQERLAFACSAVVGELWPSLLEKAFAKVRGLTECTWWLRGLRLEVAARGVELKGP